MESWDSQGAEHAQGFGVSQELRSPWKQETHKELSIPKDLGIFRSWEAFGGCRPHRKLNIPGDLGRSTSWGVPGSWRPHRDLSIPRDLGISRSWEAPRAGNPTGSTASLGIWELSISGDLGMPRSWRSYRETEILQGAEHCWGFGDAQELGTPQHCWGFGNPLRGWGAWGN